MFRPHRVSSTPRGAGKEASVKRTFLRTGSICAAVIALAMPATAAPPPTPGAQVLAARGANAFVASNPSVLMASPDEQYVQQGLTSSAGLQYVSYERTFHGLPVVGG